MFVNVPPQRIFEPKSCVLSGALDKIFFVATHDAPEVTIQKMDPEEIARRMVFSLQHEQMTFLSYYLKFRFAFPGLANGLIEGSQKLQAEALHRLLQDKETYCVYHPYPVSIPSLFDAMRPYCT
jgi:hypothetical protein